MLLPAAKLALAPLLLLQGRRVRQLALRLPEAAGEREAMPADGVAALKLLIVGDSATAGVGAAHQREALAGRLAERLTERLPARSGGLHWRLVARSGATTADALSLLEAEPGADAPAPGASTGAANEGEPDARAVGAAEQPAGRPFRADLAVLAVGVNDVTGQVPIRRWLQRMELLARRLEQVHGVRLLVVSGLPPMHLFPALPQPLRWYLGACARRYDRALRRWAGRRPRTVFVPLPAMRDPAMMAVDGFHPGPPAYGLWAQALASEIAAAGGLGLIGPDRRARAGESAPPPA